MIRALIVEDSPIFAAALADVLAGAGDITVVGHGADGREAVELAERLRPDVILMDVLMPRMGGLEAIERIMASRPAPILVVTSDPRGRTGELAVEALRRGATDLVVKPETWPVPAAEREALVERTRLVARVPVVRRPLPRRRSRAATPRPALPRGHAGAPAARVVGVVASTGGPAALATVLAALPATLSAAVAVVQHIGEGFDESFAAWLGRETALEVEVAADGEVVRAGHVYVAPAGAHLEVSPLGRWMLDPGPPVAGNRPSGDRLLASLARVYGSAAIGVVLTGMGRDGVEGLGRIKARGGRTLAQDEATSVVYGMPREALQAGVVGEVLALDALAARLQRLCG